MNFLILRFYLFENESDLLDKLDKISNIFIAVLAFLFSVFIFFNTRNRENNREEKNKKIDFLKVLLLENNSEKLLEFYDQILNIIMAQTNQTLSDLDKAALLELINDQHKIFRLKFYDLILPFDSELYKKIKNETDDLIDNLTDKIFDPVENFFQNNKIDILEQRILKSRTEVLRIILKIQ